MDIYHKVLVKLYEETAGRDSRAIDLQDLVKKIGFAGHYSDILGKLGGEGWIAEDAKRNFVRITHWGVAEAKKSLSDAPVQNSKPADKNAEICLSLVRELTEALQIVAAGTTADNVARAEKKLAELQSAFAGVKSGAEAS